MTHHLAHLNVARQRAAYDSPLFADFVSRLASVNGVADASPGFVWRLAEGSKEAGPDPFDDGLTLTNLSLWSDVAALRAFVYGTDHAAVMRERARWFLPPNGPAYVLWWVPAGERPSLAEARRRFELLAATGPSPDAFTFARSYPPPGGEP